MCVMHTKGMSDLIDIRRLRESMGLSQAQFAERLGVDRTSVAHFENGRKPRKALAAVIERMSAEAKFARPREAAQ